LCRTAAQHEQALDETWGGPQKVHAVPTPRIGGVAVAAGIAAGTATLWALDEEIRTWLLLLVCVAPGFAWGLIEDLTKRGEVMVRLVLTAISAGVAFVLVDARITAVDLPLIDNALEFTALSFAFTLFAVAGVSHATNVIDGLNGLSGIISILAAMGLALVGWSVGDAFVASAAVIVAASMAGFLFLNFPGGRIFLGDGGAYLVGLLLAELSVLLVHRNSEVSVWFPLVLLAYPIWETIFSMLRRRSRGCSTGKADRLHLHSLVYHRVSRAPSRKTRDLVARNSRASILLWPLPVGCCLAALALWEDSLSLQIAACAFAILYTGLYLLIVRFRLARVCKFFSARSLAVRGALQQNSKAPR
jgi:UDP-N-acetylmuramyl pentapeptide phosphotransferase/UDP-N-acetylglucosamine-1-phosphate transferase